MFSDVVEYFTSFQGEGPRQGQRATFIRFKSCNYTCPFCDTMYRIKNIKPFKLKFPDVIQNMIVNNVPYLVFTGGEPLLPKYRQSIIKFLNYDRSLDKVDVVGIETNGWFIPDLLKNIEDVPKEKQEKVEVYWSPKVWEDSSTGYSKDSYFQILKKILSSSTDITFYLKFVVYDLELIKFLIYETLGHGFPAKRIYLMPMGRNAAEMWVNVPDVIQLVTEFGLNFSSRLHILGMVP